MESLPQTPSATPSRAPVPPASPEASGSDESRRESQPLVETRYDDGWFRLEHPDLEKPRNLTAPEKLALERADAVLTAKAEERNPVCWCYDCDDHAVAWVREVAFDFKGTKAEPVQHKQISSADYTGPVPGFCWRHTTEGPRQLAETVYWHRPEIRWGAKPTRWFVVFTDGLRVGGDCASLDPEQAHPTITRS